MPLSATRGTRKRAPELSVESILEGQYALQPSGVAPQCAAGTDRLTRPHLQPQLPTAHAGPAPGEREPGCTLSLGLPGPGFQSADLLSAKDKQFQFFKSKEVPTD